MYQMYQVYQVIPGKENLRKEFSKMIYEKFKRDEKS
jgi:hypothetical protein